MKKEFKLISFSYSPGYGDMLGGYHSAELRREKDGRWTFVCRDRETHCDPEIRTVYAVSADDAEQFGRFIEKKRILSLGNRPKSDLFVTDYSPWRYTVDAEVTSFGKTKSEYVNIDEYKKYSKKDYSLLSELREKFYALRGEKFSESKGESLY